MTIINDSPAEPAKLDYLERKALDLRRNRRARAADKGQGYLGQGFALADFLAAFYFHELRYDPDAPAWQERDRFYLSTGHYSIALWAVLAEAGYFTKDMLATYGADGSPLEMSTIEGRVPA